MEDSKLDRASLGNTGLSNREEQILWEAAKGLTDKEISARLHISTGTTRTYWERIRKRLGAKNRAEVMAMVLARLYQRASDRAAAGELLFKSLLDQSTLGFAIIDERLPKILHMNPAMRVICDASPEAPANGSEDSADEHNLAAIQVLLKEYEDGKDSARNGFAEYSVVKRALTVEGRELSLLQISEKTGSLSALAAMSKLEAFYRTILGSQSAAVLILARNGTILFASQSAKECLRREPNDLVARRLQDLCIDGHLAKSLLMQSAGSPNSEPTLLTFRDSNGEPFNLSANATSRLNDGDIRGILLHLEVPAVEALPLF